MIPEGFRAVCETGIPATVVTSDKSGTPNVTFLSRAYYVDEEHVALSFQFFNKTKRNISENPRARLSLIDPMGAQTWNLDLEFLRTETSGPLFEEMDMMIEAIASATGMSGVFKLRGADIYRVTNVRQRPFDGVQKG